MLIDSLGEKRTGWWALGAVDESGCFKNQRIPARTELLGSNCRCFGIATTYPDEIFTEIFGLTQIIWFIWLGVSLLGQSNAHTYEPSRS